MKMQCVRCDREVDAVVLKNEYGHNGNYHLTATCPLCGKYIAHVARTQEALAEAEKNAKDNYQPSLV